jgi:lipopolysaccharide transport system permease protein
MITLALFLGRMGGLSSGNIPYPLFIYAGLLPWTFFAAAIGNAANSVVNSGTLITKVHFPRLAIPVAAVGAALVDCFIAFSVLAILMVWYGIGLSWSILLVPALTLLVTAAALGVGTLLAALNVSYRDFRYVIPFLIQLWMFATPSIYLATTAHSSETATPLIQSLLILNPMTGVIAAFRAAMLGETLPWPALGWSAGVIVLVVIVGCCYFRRMEDSFADII